MSKHLWEVDHPYYANEGNYFSQDCHTTFKTWPRFAADSADEDLDLNLVYRWDWKEGEDDEAGAFNGDENYRNGRLLIFYIGQRKALARSVEIEVCRADEPAVIEWLRPRFAKLMDIWEPLSPPNGSEPEARSDGA